MKQSSILVVDDDQQTVNILSRALTRAGYDVHTALSGEAAMETLNAMTFDLIISDQQMDGMEGTAFFEEAKKIRPDAVRILVTGRPDVDVLMDAINQGEIYRFITKPFDLESLLISVRHALKQKGLIEEKKRLTNRLQEKKRLEEVIINSRNKLMVIFDTIAEHILSLDSTYNIVFANKAFSEDLGEEAKSIPGQKCYTIKHGLDTPCFEYGYACPAQSVFNSGIPYSSAGVHLDSEGRKRYDEFSVLPVRNSSGKVIQVIKISRDITAQMESEEALRESEEFTRRIINSSADCIKILDLEGRLLFMSPGGQRLRGIDDINPFLNKSWIEYWEGADKDAAFAAISKAKQGDVGTFRGYCPSLNGKPKWWDVVITPIVGANGSVDRLLSVSRDITDRKRVEDKLASARAQLHQSEKMAAIGQLAAGVAHEINNPIGFINSNLSTLKGYVEDLSRLINTYEKLQKEVLSRSEERDSRHANLVNAIDRCKEDIDYDFVMNDLDKLISESQEGTERVKKIVSDLKDFSHAGKDELQYADINRCVESTLNIVWNEIKYKTTVAKEFGDLPEVYCYPHKLNQVFMNLFVNAAQAIEKKGEIRISTRFCDSDAPYVEIKISDTGSGIPEEFLPRIFDPFFTTKPVGEGTGLGLHMAYGIVEKHHGRIDVKSEVGKGTTFTIVLPVKDEE
jgi:two-component system NtrC family sensor kinase